MIVKRSSSGKAMVLILLPTEENVAHLADEARLAKVVDHWGNLSPKGSIVVDLPKATKGEKPKASKKSAEKVTL